MSPLRVVLVVDGVIEADALLEAGSAERLAGVWQHKVGEARAEGRDAWLEVYEVRADGDVRILVDDGEERELAS